MPVTFAEILIDDKKCRSLSISDCIIVSLFF